MSISKNVCLCVEFKTPCFHLISFVIEPVVQTNEKRYFKILFEDDSCPYGKNTKGFKNNTI